jgi:hypothetical protein
VDIDFLFASALAVLNRALDAHRGTSRYDQILAGHQEELRGRFVWVEVFDEDAGTTIARYAVRFHNGLLEATTGGGQMDHVGQKVSTHYLEQIVEHAERFIRYPEKLNWEWLRDSASVRC